MQNMKKTSLTLDDNGEYSCQTDDYTDYIKSSNSSDSINIHVLGNFT